MENNERLTLTIDNLSARGYGSRNTLYSLAKQDKLPWPVIRIGKRFYVSRRAVEQLEGKPKAGESSGL